MPFPPRHRRPPNETRAHSCRSRRVAALALGAVKPGPAAFAAEGDTEENAAETLKNRELPPGPNFELYKASCLTCHTSSYVIKTPKSPRSHWEMEVKKMVDLYDAPIQAGDQKLIVDYLMSVRGLPEKPAK